MNTDKRCFLLLLVGVHLCSSLADFSSAQTKPSSRRGGEIVPPARRDVPGKRMTLSRGELFVPDFFHTDGKADVAVWFLGATWCAEQVFYDAHKSAVLLVTNGATLKRGFPRATDFDDMLQEAAGALDRLEVTDEGFNRVTLISFSGGWTGVYSVLSHPQLGHVIDNVVLLDSLYARNKASGEIDEDAIAPFLTFAQRAADSHATFVFTQLYPPEEKYRTNGTSVCASYLIDKLAMERKDASGTSAAGAKLLYRADKGNAHILGYAGMTNQDHFNHFYGAADAIKMTSIPDARDEAKKESWQPAGTDSHR